jgi:hypothetical protein
MPPGAKALNRTAKKASSVPLLFLCEFVNFSFLLGLLLYLSTGAAIINHGLAAYTAVTYVLPNSRDWKSKIKMSAES